MDNYELEFMIEQAFRQYDNYHLQRRPFNVKCKCHICGDSQKNPHLARLNAYYYDNALLVNCYNCGYSSSVPFYLKQYHPYQWSIYQDKLKTERIKKFLEKDRKPDIKFKTFEDFIEEVEEEEIVYPTELPYCYRIDMIQEDHPSVQYVINRKIPRDKWDRLFFTNEFRKLANYAVPNTYAEEYNEPRLVIPIYNRKGQIESFQGRALLPNATLRYVTIKFNDKATKIYGLDTVDYNRTAYFLEGQIDSLFIDNGMAITGGNISIDELDEVYPFDRAFIMDNENRHPDTIKRIEKLIDSNEKIVLFDKVDWKGKDINQFVENGVSIEDINEYIKNNTIDGMEARFRFNQWAKVNVKLVKEERKKRYHIQNLNKSFDQFLNKAKGCI